MNHIVTTRPASHPDPVSAVTAELEVVSQSPEFALFREYRVDLVAWALSHEGRALENAETSFLHEDKRLRDGVARARTRLRWRNVVLGALLGLWTALFLVLTLLAVVLTIAPSQDFGRGPAFSMLVVYLTFLLGGVWGLLWLRRAPRVRELESRRADHAARHAARRRIQAAEAYRRALNQVLGAQDRLPFPTQAPDLVERSAQAIAPSRTIEQVCRFVHGHTTSAVGLAGPRGSGKSTLITYVVDDPDTLAVELLVSSSQERGDVLRRLSYALDAALRPDRSADPAFEAPVAAARRGRLGAAAAIALALGAPLLALDVLEPGWLSTVSAAGLIGVLLVVAAVFALVSLAFPDHGVLGRADLVRRAPRESGAALLSARLAEDLAVEVSESDDTSASLSLSSVLGIEHTSGRSRTRRALGPVDLVDRLRALLLKLGEERREAGQRVVVVVDELDKLPDVDSLVAVVNGLKDLFRIPGIHFLVSVSHEALNSFELRGLQQRDAFDSSFDTVFSMSRVTSDQALEILRSRVTGFPEPLGRVCHVWAGGLPRDLIRAARECVEINAELDGAAPWPAIARHFMRLDLARRIAAIRAQGWIVHDDPVRKAQQRIESGTPLALPVHADRRTALYACSSQVDLSSEALERLERDPSPSRQAVCGLDDLAEEVASLSERAVLGVARLDVDEVFQSTQPAEAGRPHTTESGSNV